MEISNSSQLPHVATLTLSKPAIKAWQVGQLLNAVVVKSTSPEHIILSINNTTVQASSGQLNPAPGQTLKLEVVRTTPQAILKIVNNTQTTQPHTEALKSLLPRQMPFPPLLANLAFLTGDGGRLLPALPHNVDQMIKKLMVDLPTEKKLSNADGLKRALLLSGLFLENKLVGTGAASKGNSSAIDQDLKGTLLRLLNNLQHASSTMNTQSDLTQSPDKQTSSPLLPHTPLQVQPRSTASVQGYHSSSQIITELLQQVNGAIARIQINQIASLPGDDNIPPVLSVELPLRQENRIDVIQIRISQDRSANPSENANRWSAALAMELESLGTVYANVTISQQQVWTSLWAERKSTVDIINKHLQDLFRGYSRAGLSMGTTQCFHGAPPPPVKNARKILVDTNA